jgi:16S rRNA processing protein RimM
MSAPESQELLCVGVVTGPHGVRGQVRIKGFTANPEDIAAYGALSDQTGTKTYVVKVTGTAAKGALIASLTGIDNRNKAEAIKGLKLYVPRSALPEPEEEEYYHADLIGLSVQTVDGLELGVVRTIYDFGAGDVIEVENGERKTIVVPFTKAAVPVVDLAAGRLIVDPPEGLLDEPEPGEQAKEGKTIKVNAKANGD